MPTKTPHNQIIWSLNRHKLYLPGALWGVPPQLRTRHLVLIPTGSNGWVPAEQQWTQAQRGGEGGQFGQRWRWDYIFFLKCCVKWPCSPAHVRLTWELPAIVPEKTVRRGTAGNADGKEELRHLGHSVSLQLPSGNSISTCAHYCRLCTRTKEVHRKPSTEGFITHLKISLWSLVYTQEREGSYIAQIWSGQVSTLVSHSPTK